MLNNYYKILGCNANSTDEEINNAYLELKKKYSDEMFLEGEAGNSAAKKLTELNQAYNEIKKSREIKIEEDAEDKVSLIQKYIKEGNITGAQYVLDSYDNRDDVWHYLQSVVFYKKKWLNESKKQLEIAISMNPTEEKYKNEYKKLNEYILKDNTQPNYNQQQNQQQMGGDSCMQSLCQCCYCNMLLNCCCNSSGC